MFQSYLEIILGILPVNLFETFCLYCANMLPATQLRKSILNHTRSPGNSSTVQIGHVTERLSQHFINNIVGSVYVHVYISLFIHCVSSISFAS